MKKDLALDVLREVARLSECSATWKTLVEDRLVAAEKAMRYLLPTHRDHVLHSAHLYLLGLAIYLKMLRPVPALAAVIADNYFRDAKAFFGTPDTPYSCQRGILNPEQNLDEIRKRFSAGPFALDQRRILELTEQCNTCSPTDLATNANRDLSTQLQAYFRCCGPAPAIIQAVDNLSEAIRKLDWGSTNVWSHLPQCLEDVDTVFRRGWGLVALLHDAAYPIELAARQIDDYVERTITPLGCSFSPCPKPFGLTFNRICDFITVPLIQNVCSGKFNSVMYGDNSVMLLAANLSHKLHVEYSADTLARMMISWLEAGLAGGQIDHGVFSALLILRQTNHELLEKLGERRRNSELVVDNAQRRITEFHAASAVEFFYIECVDAAAAVYLHNAKTYIDLFKDRPLDYRNHPIAWLLFLCDQLQEWLRPSGAEPEDAMHFFGHANQYDMFVDAGPKLYFSYPGDVSTIGDTLNSHLRLFGNSFVRQAHEPAGQVRAT
jgi:hypothetical protein